VILWLKSDFRHLVGFRCAYTLGVNEHNQIQQGRYFTLKSVRLETVDCLLLIPQQTARVLLIVFMCAACWLWGLWIGRGDILTYIDLGFPDCRSRLFGHLLGIN
jgi:hypothetical protein